VDFCRRSQPSFTPSNGGEWREARGTVGYSRQVSIVHVVLFDSGAGRVLGEVDMPVTQLPESFAASTTLHLGDVDWQVVRAEPTTRAELVATGRLRLELRKIERVAPRSILFSVPTLEDVAPPTGGLIHDAVIMHEDDWRQRELVSARFAPEIAAEVAAIRAIHTEHRSGPGFTQVHVRERIPEPMAGVGLAVGELSALGARRPLAIEAGGGPPVEVVGGFAFEVETGVVYGRLEGDVVVALGLAPGTDPAPLTNLARAHDLVLVSWCTVEQTRLR
jgi:hypothetical protein